MAVAVFRNPYTGTTMRVSGANIAVLTAWGWERLDDGPAATPPDPFPQYLLPSELAQEMAAFDAPTGGVRVYATESQTVADANPEFVWLVLAPAPTPDTTAPTVPTGLAATPGDTQVVLSWSASTDAVGVTGYRVYRGGTLIASPTATTYTDTGRTNGTQYSYTVAAADAAGNVSAQTSAVTATPAPAVTVPGAPTSVSGTAGNGQVALTWTAPASNGGAAITDYIIQYSSNSGTSWSTFTDTTSTATSATVTGLTNATAYDFRVSAVNAVGTGTASSVATATPAAASTAASVVSQTTTIVPTAAGTTRTFNLPATVAAGDILVLVGAGNIDGTVTGPAGWTTRTTHGGLCFVMTKTADGSEGGGTVATTWSVSPGNSVVTRAYSLRGLSSEVPVQTATVPVAYGDTVTVPTLTGLPADSLLLGVAKRDGANSGSTSTSPSGFVHDSTEFTNVAGAIVVDYSHQLLPAGGSGGGGSWAFSTPGTGEAILVAFS